MGIKRVFKRGALLASTALAITGQSGVAHAQGEDEGDVIVVVGSRIERSAEDTASQPVQFIDEAFFKTTPAENVADFLREIPINTGASASNFNDEYNGGNSSINLRGVGPQFTLVLLNGRRFGGESVPDIGAIPPEAVETVEILKTGASSVYGSDAVAGVVNIRLKEDFEGLDVVASYGGATQGGGETFRVAAVGGFQTERLSFTGSLAYQDYKGFNRDERVFTSSRDYRRFGGIDRRSGFIGDPNAIFIPSSGNVVTLDTNQVGLGDVPTSPGQFIPFPDENNRFSTNEPGVAPPVERINGHWSVKYDLVPDLVEFYTEGYVDTREQEFFAQVPIDFGANVPATNPFNPFGEDVSARFVLSELDFITETANVINYQAAAGFKGALGDLNYDVSYTRYRQSNERDYTGELNPAGLAAALSRTDATALNPFCDECNTDAQLAGIIAPPGFIDQNDQIQTIDVVFSGDVFELPAGAVSFAAGYQHRAVDFDVNYNDVWENGSTQFSWFTSDFADTSGSRNVDAVFGEVLLPLYESANPDAVFTQAEVTGSVRYENYSDFGGATVFSALGKTEWFGGDVILRASYTESFRAPPVAALTLPERTLFEPSGGGVFDPVRGGFLPTFFRTGGNPDLGPEEGTTFSVGAVLRPSFIEGFFASIDYFDLEITNIIRTPDAQGLLEGTETAGTITRDANNVPTLDLRLNNGGDRTVRGYDFSVSQTFDTDRVGTFNIYANGVVQVENERFENGVTTNLLGEFLEGPIPRFRGIFGVGWAGDAVDFAANVDYATGVNEFLDAGAVVIDRKTDDWVTVDMQIGYDFSNVGPKDSLITKNLRAYIGVENIFDDGLPFFARSSDGWDRAIGDLRGRYVYGGVRKSF